MLIRGFYSVGTISIEEGASVATGSGTAWLSNVKQGDFVIGWDGLDSGFAVLAEDPETNIDLTFANPWRGPELSDAATYLILRTGPAWRSAATLHNSVAEFIHAQDDVLAALEAAPLDVVLFANVFA